MALRSRRRVEAEKDVESRSGALVSEIGRSPHEPGRFFLVSLGKIKRKIKWRKNENETLTFPGDAPQPMRRVSIAVPSPYLEVELECAPKGRPGPPALATFHQASPLIAPSRWRVRKAVQRGRNNTARFFAVLLVFSFVFPLFVRFFTSSSHDRSSRLSPLVSFRLISLGLARKLTNEERPFSDFSPLRGRSVNRWTPFFE